METRAEANTIHSQGCFEDGRTAARPVAGGWGGGWGAGSRSPWPSLADPDPETHLGVGGMGGRRENHWRASLRKRLWLELPPELPTLRISEAEHKHFSLILGLLGHR